MDDVAAGAKSTDLRGFAGNEGMWSVVDVIPPDTSSRASRSTRPPTTTTTRTHPTRRDQPPPALHTIGPDRLRGAGDELATLQRRPKRLNASGSIRSENTTIDTPIIKFQRPILEGAPKRSPSSASLYELRLDDDRDRAPPQSGTCQRQRGADQAVAITARTQATLSEHCADPRQPKGCAPRCSICPSKQDRR